MPGRRTTEGDDNKSPGVIEIPEPSVMIVMIIVMTVVATEPPSFHPIYRPCPKFAGEPADLNIYLHLNNNDVMKVEKTYMSNSNQNVQEMIRVAMQCRSKTVQNITKKDILKILFLAREHMSEKNSIRHDLAFYWYLNGPYSDTIEDNLKILVDEKKIIRSKTSQSEAYRIVPEHASRPIVAHNEFMDEAAREIRHIVDKSVNVNKLVRQVYETSAPTKWYISYRLEFLPKFKSYSNDICKKRKSSFAPKDMLRLLDDAVLDFPTNSEFLGIRMIFMDFAKMTNAFLRWDEHTSHDDLLKELHVMGEEIWVVFAHGIRVYHHDVAYKNRVNSWRTAYESVLNELDSITLQRVKKFDELVSDDLRLAPELEDMILHPEQHTFTSKAESVADAR